MLSVLSPLWKLVQLWLTNETLRILDGLDVVSVVTRREKLLCRLGMLTLWLASGAGLKTIVERPQPCRRKW